MKILLIGLALITTGCASVPDLPDVVQTFGEYEVAEYEPIEAIEAMSPEVAGECVFDGRPAVALTVEQFAVLQELDVAANANYQALIRLNAAMAAKHQEVALLVQAGISSEQMAELYRALYLNEISSARAQALLMSTGALGALLLGLGFAL